MAPHRDNQTIYAVKIISKNKVIQAQQSDHLFNEIKYMAKLKSQLMCRMRGVAQDSRNLYILMDYMQTGELLNILKKVGGRMNGHMAKFYAAQIVLSFEYLHGQDLIYRDLKPENLLLTESGYVKVIDMGFARKLEPAQKAFTLCGTPYYLAPEMILHVGHDKGLDYWCLGVLRCVVLVAHTGTCPVARCACARHCYS